MVWLKGSLKFQIWIDVIGCLRMDLMVLMVSGEDLDYSRNFKQKLFSRMRHSGFLVVSSIAEFMFDLH